MFRTLLKSNDLENPDEKQLEYVVRQEVRGLVRFSKTDRSVSCPYRYGSRTHVVFLDVMMQHI